MNVLFYTYCEVSPQKGGVEHVTSIIAAELTKSGISCYSIYQRPIANTFTRTTFVKSCCIGLENLKEKISSFIIENQIDIIINQSLFYQTELLREVINSVRPQCKIIFCHHFAPGSEQNFHCFSALWKTIKEKHNCTRNCIKLALYPVWRPIQMRRIRENYLKTYRCADLVVLLSNKYRDDFMTWGKITNTTKFREIHNSLSFSSFFDMKEYAQKEKTVLIVARMEEKQKKISLALKIWKELENEPLLSDWKLKIVGHGSDLDRYRRFTARHNLQRVSFEGKQNSEPYYRTAKLFMMTSSFEGWPLTLIEAQQMGCVPLAFDSFASLPDVITDGENGYIVPYGDLRQYADKMKELMLDADLRRKMAANAIESCKRFEKRVIMEQWKSLLDELMIKA